MARTRTQLLTSSGKKIDQIPVQLSYQIIKHFSAGLYTSPFKAIEELVANSYDAWATHVHVILPQNLSAAAATIWVIDNGESMDVSGFKQLWRIGESSKRDPGKESSERPPIGKFGIGKLATYVLAKELTYVCKRGGKYRAVTMDFAQLELRPDRKRISLKVRGLSAEEANQILHPVLQWEASGDVGFRLFGTGAAKSWTVAAMSSLTLMAQKLTEGRLKRVLTTALPINPQFNLYYCGEKLLPEKLSAPQIDQWTIGKSDNVAEELGFEQVDGKTSMPGVSISLLGKIWGEVQLFEDPLTQGKAAEWGRSHGFFVIVRGRLLNLHDELFGLEALSHGAFSRFRMVVHADGLDEYLRATRENVSEEPEGVKNFRAYLKAKFNETRARYESWITTEEARKSIPKRISSTPRSLSRTPLIHAIRKVFDGSLDGLFLTRVPPNLKPEEKESLLRELEQRIQIDDFFKDVRFEPLGMEQGLAVFDLAERCFKVNLLHPFFANYCDHSRSHELFQLLAVAEVLTEAYLVEEDLSSDQVRHLMLRRDRFLRELVFSTQLAAPLVAQLLDDNRSDPKGLEKAIFEGMKSLGFEVSKLGGAKKGPDGLALARMGVRNESTGKSESYTVAYDSKSTGGERISAKDLVAATIAQHREDATADFSLVVAPGFDGDGGRGSNVVKQAIKQNITLITLEDFIRLVLAASTRPLGFARLRDEFFMKCRGPLDAKEWIKSLLSEQAGETPLPDILQAIWQMQKDSPDPPKFSAVRERLAMQNQKFKSIREQEIRDWLQSVQRFERDLITIENERVYLENPPEKILQRVLSHTSKLPKAILQSSMYAGFLQPSADRSAKGKKAAGS